MHLTQIITASLIISLLSFHCKESNEDIRSDSSFGKFRITVPKSVVEDLVINSDIVKTKENNFEFILEGVSYPSPKNIPLTPDDINDRNTIESLISNDHYANQLDNEEMISSNWSLNDQSNLQEMLADKKVRSRSKKFVREITKLQLHFVLRYKGYYFALVEIGHNQYPYSAVMTISKSEEGYFLTNILASDEIFHLVWTAFAGDGTIDKL